MNHQIIVLYKGHALFIRDNRKYKIINKIAEKKKKIED
jgi:hypothetical protein